MQDIETRTIRKILARIVLFMGIIYITNLLARFNIGYASLTMNSEVGLSPAQYGFGAGLFSAAYLAAEIPSNLGLLRYGARLWITRIMITWGLASAAMALVSGPYSFYALRALLGAAEAGFLPGAMLYLATWVPAQHRSKAVLLFFALGQFAGLFGPIVSAEILKVDSLLGMRNWQALFVIEALPVLILAFFTMRFLPNGPDDVRWLDKEERQWLESELATSSKATAAHGHSGLMDGMRDWKVWALFISKFANGLAVFTIGLWLPQMAREATGLAIGDLGLLVAVPSIIVIPFMWFFGNYSDRTGNRPRHTAIMLGICGISSGGAAIGSDPYLSLAFIFLASIAAVTATAVSWAIAPAFLQGRAAAGGFAIVNAGGIVGGFVAGSVLGVLRELTGDHDAGLYLISGACILGAASVLLLGRALPRASLATGQKN